MLSRNTSQTKSMMWSELLSTPELNYESWVDALRPQWGRYNPVAVEPEIFTGRARSRSPWGLVAIDLSCSAHRVERTQRDVRLDGVDYYFCLFQVAGRSTIVQNDQAIRLAVGDAALLDSTRPGTYVLEDRCGRWLSLQLPRRLLVSRLGFTPHSGVLGRGETAAGRLLLDIIWDTDIGDGSTSDSYMQLAVYDLIGALFAPPDLAAASPHSDKLFKRICDIIRDHFADPAFGPREAAAEAGISLRYLQKLFISQNSTCSHFIRSVRLDYAAHLLHRRELLGANQPLGDIAYACGFTDYTNFARQFRRRFGHTPGAHGAGDGTDDPTVGRNPKSASKAQQLAR